jgi:predicted membrane protein
LLIGVTIVLLGLVFLADGLGMLDAHSGWALWPIVVIVAGVAVRLQPGVADRIAGAVLIVAGIWLLFNEIGIWAYSFWRTWPLILMLLGGWIAYGTWHMRLAGTGQAGVFAFLSQVDDGAGGRLRGIELSAVAGECTFDLGGAIRGDEPIIVDAFTVGGRIRVAVPEDWAIELRVLPLLGKATDARDGSGGSDRTVDVVIRGTAIVGVVEVIASTAASSDPVASI